MMNRGDIYWVDLEPTRGSEINKLRPCVLISATAINQVRRTVVVVPLSTAATPRPPIVVAVKCLDRAVAAVCDQVRAIDKSRLTKPAGHLSAADLTMVDEGLRIVLGL